MYFKNEKNKERKRERAQKKKKETERATKQRTRWLTSGFSFTSLRYLSLKVKRSFIQSFYLRLHEDYKEYIQLYLSLFLEAKQRKMENPRRKTPKKKKKVINIFMKN